MKKIKISICKRPVLVVGICCYFSALWAGNNYSINKYVIANGGGTSSAYSMQIQGTIAQVTTGQSAGNAYSIQNGYWHENDSFNDLIFSNGFE